MTLKAFFDLIAENPAFIVFFFLIIPFTAIIAGIMGKDEGHLSPWKYLYSSLVYISCVPGIFSITLNIYLFLFERQSVFQMDLFTQLLPVLCMIVTLLIIRRNVNLDSIPGFDKLSGLVLMIAAVLSFMWIADRTRVFLFSYLPFQYVILIFAGLLLIIRFGWSKMLANKQTSETEI